MSDESEGWLMKGSGGNACLSHGPLRRMDPVVLTFFVLSGRSSEGQVEYSLESSRLGLHWWSGGCYFTFWRRGCRFDPCSGS